MDHALDIVTTPDLAAWHYKDEAELQELQALGLFSAELVQQIRRAGERAIEHIRAKAFPFSAAWAQWSPPSTWPVPALPSGWDEV